MKQFSWKVHALNLGLRNDYFVISVGLLDDIYHSVIFNDTKASETNQQVISHEQNH